MATPYRQIRADFDDRTIVVYQAYRSEIADAAVAAQRFVPPFSLGRMTWIKPSFLWMMQRSGWATKPGQERVLAVRITRQGFEEALAAAKLSSGNTAGAQVVVQWDPERSLRGAKLEYRSIEWEPWKGSHSLPRSGSGGQSPLTPTRSRSAWAAASSAGT